MKNNFLDTLEGSWIFIKKENDLPKESKDWNNKPAKKRREAFACELWNHPQKKTT